MKINFHYSSVYDAMLSEMSNTEQDLYQVRQLSTFTQKFETNWRKKELKIIKSIEKHSKLKFKSNITAYFVKEMLYSGISIPLTLQFNNNIDLTEKTLIHELIHNLMSQNEKKLKPLMIDIYPEEDWSFKIHVPVLLIEKRVFKDIYGQKATETFITKDRRIFGPEWIEVKRIENKYKGDLVKFLKNENLE